MAAIKPICIPDILLRISSPDDNMQRSLRELEATYRDEHRLPRSAAVKGGCGGLDNGDAEDLEAEVRDYANIAHSNCFPHKPCNYCTIITII